MGAGFKVFSTPCFNREFKKIHKKDKNLFDVLKKIAEILTEDPFNQNKKYDIKKLIDIKNGGGQWRIRFGNYRFRYDIFKNQVILHSVKDRKDIYK